ncbi:precorrin-6A synthase (deacetylating) [Methylobacterium planeticum]|uniref:Precorrin-6A synthase [deacetylating] n=1 Tax=Methylobacterium planeticum TaxID=2615211 RepID=A0A6N6MVX0_9HYPH|nr:precorrin-6A synthase (deacetylating) [Methylobacterium planeticum]KAB1073130.1 precorrin-6A synthase (deacetylating) [Methylobacterium planeticum]
MRKLRIIGIGAGNPEHLTLQAVRALEQVEAVFVLDKGEVKADLLRLRREICERFITRPFHFVEAQDPERDRNPQDYAAAVEAWHTARAILYETLIDRELGEGGCGAILVWGDPALYDSTLRIVDRIVARGRLALDYDVIPGISSVQALAASHRIALNRIGGPVHITTGRAIADGLPPDAESIVVMLDGDPRFDHLDPELTIYWGAYLGTPNEIVLSGRLGSIASEIRHVRAEARSRHGWIMDTYLLRKPDGR